MPTKDPTGDPNTKPGATTPPMPSAGNPAKAKSPMTQPSSVASRSAKRRTKKRGAKPKPSAPTSKPTGYPTAKPSPPKHNPGEQLLFPSNQSVNSASSAKSHQSKSTLSSKDHGKRSTKNENHPPKITQSPAPVPKSENVNTKRGGDVASPAISSKGSISSKNWNPEDDNQKNEANGSEGEFELEDSVA